MASSSEEQYYDAVEELPSQVPNPSNARKVPSSTKVNASAVPSSSKAGAKRSK